MKQRIESAVSYLRSENPGCGHSFCDRLGNTFRKSEALKRLDRGEETFVIATKYGQVLDKERI